MDIYDNIFLNLPKNETYQAKIVEKKHKFYVQYFFNKILPFMKQRGKIAGPDRPQMTTQYGACVLHAG
jgi:hypothetical protein